MGKRQHKAAPRLGSVSFSEESRREFLTGFHKRKVERRKKATDEIKQKLKEEQRRVKVERHKEYVKMFQERKEALEEAEELDQLVTSQLESVQYDHPNHTVTVTTISDIDLTGGRLGLGSEQPEAARKQPPPQSNVEEGEEPSTEKENPLPRKLSEPIISKKISSLTSALHSTSVKKTKGKKVKNVTDENKKVVKGKTSKSQRRRRTGRPGGEKCH
uniref:Nucleolar protein 12 n=1 Tax=Callorhinchus milii TaxID=7868 RepID=V9KUI4_CALMI